MPRPKTSTNSNLFTNEPRKRTALSPFFVRKPYQYTIAEHKDQNQPQEEKKDEQSY